jgi:hypothetical protein
VYNILFRIVGNVLNLSTTSSCYDHLSNTDADDTLIEGHFKKKWEDNIKNIFKFSENINLVYGSGSSPVVSSSVSFVETSVFVNRGSVS